MILDKLVLECCMEGIVCVLNDNGVNVDKIEITILDRGSIIKGSMSKIATMRENR